jgi:hypothetical protein
VATVAIDRDDTIRYDGNDIAVIAIDTATTSATTGVAATFDRNRQQALKRLHWKQTELNGQR